MKKPVNLVIFAEAVVTVFVASGLIIKSVESDVSLYPLSLSSLLNHGFQIEGRNFRSCSVRSFKNNDVCVDIRFCSVAVFLPPQANCGILFLQATLWYSLPPQVRLWYPASAVHMLQPTRRAMAFSQ